MPIISECYLYVQHLVTILDESLWEEDDDEEEEEEAMATTPSASSTATGPTPAGTVATPVELATSVVPETTPVRWRVDNFDQLNDEASNDDSKSVDSPYFSAAGRQWYLKLRSCFTQDRGVHKDKVCTGNSKLHSLTHSLTHSLASL
jgi:hypothetical protein